MLSLTEDTVPRGKAYSCSLNLCSLNSSEAASNIHLKKSLWLAFGGFVLFLLCSSSEWLGKVNIVFSIINLSIDIPINKKTLISITKHWQGDGKWIGPWQEVPSGAICDPHASSEF